MRRFNVTVNGNTYEVDVEEVMDGNNVQIAAPVVHQTSAPQVQNSQPTPAKTTSVIGIKVEAPMQGKIVGIKVVEGQKVQDGDVIAILEAMKMENEIIVTSSGVVGSVNVAVGQAVEAGDLIASIN